MDYFKDKMSLYKLESQIRSLEKFYLGEIKKGKIAGDSRQDIDVLYGEFMAEKQVYELDRDLLRSRLLQSKARKYNVPIPKLDDKNMWERHFGYIYLSDEGYFNLNRAIRKEQKERRESIVQIVTVIAGAGGVLIGLISVLKL